MCGDTIRLEHMETGKNLHSHNMRSPITNKNEVSAYGDDGEGDEGDNWIIECINKKDKVGNPGEKIYGNTVIQLKHKLTNTHLSCEKRNDYNHRNCPRCPIVGQLEANCA